MRKSEIKNTQLDGAHSLAKFQLSVEQRGGVNGGSRRFRSFKLGKRAGVRRRRRVTFVSSSPSLAVKASYIINQ